MDKLISIIVPVYNTDKYLDRCLNSLINQSYPSLQIILVDDGSTDNSRDICQQYASKDERIIIISQPHLGVSAARNAGLAIAQGDFIGFVDSDDFCDPTMFEVLLNTAIQEKADAVRCGYDYVYIDTHIPFVVSPDPKHFVTGWQAIIDELTLGNTSCHGTQLWNTLFSIEKVNNPSKVQFDLSMSYGEDTDWLNHVLIRCQKVGLLPDILYHYNVGNLDSLTHKRNEDYFTARGHHHEKIITFLQDNNFPDYIIEKEKNEKDLFFIRKIIEEHLVKKSKDPKAVYQLPLNSFFAIKTTSLVGKIKNTIVLIMIKLHLPRFIIKVIWNFHRKSR